MVIRDIQPADREQLAAMLRRTAAFAHDDVDLALELIDDRLAKGSDSDYQFVVAADGSTVLGYACFGLIPLTESSFDLYWIVVAPECQGRGVGSRLIKAVEAMVKQRGGARVYIETPSTQPYAGARAFYASQGYVEAAAFPDFYRDGEAKIVYSREL